MCNGNIRVIAAKKQQWRPEDNDMAYSVGGGSPEGRKIVNQTSISSVIILQKDNGR